MTANYFSGIYDIFQGTRYFFCKYAAGTSPTFSVCFFLNILVFYCWEHHGTGSSPRLSKKSISKGLRILRIAQTCHKTTLISSFTSAQLALLHYWCFGAHTEQDARKGNKLPPKVKTSHQQCAFHREAAPKSQSFPLRPFHKPPPCSPFPCFPRAGPTAEPCADTGCCEPGSAVSRAWL